MHIQNQSHIDCSLSEDVVIITNDQCKVITTVMCEVSITLSDNVLNCVLVHYSSVQVAAKPQPI